MARIAAAAFLLIEIASLVVVGRWLGVLAALLLVVLAALLGAALLRRRGGDALRGLRGTLAAGRDPLPRLLRGGFGVVAGVLLIVPGFASDLLALLLLLRPVQVALGAALARRVVRAGVAAGAPGAARRPARAEVPEADWEELPAPPRDPRRPPSGWTRR